MSARMLVGVCLLVAMLASGVRPVASSQQAGTPERNSTKALYEAKCSQCHGLSGRGDGPAAALLDPPPRDFTMGNYKLRTTETGSLPTDDDLARSITDGMPGSAMLAWKPFLSEGQVRDLVDYLKAFSPRFKIDRPQPIPDPVEVPGSPESIAAGQKVYATLRCGSCHGSDGTADDAIATRLKDDAGRDVRMVNLTEPWTFKGGPSARDIYVRFRTGMNGTPMPSFAGAATDRDMWDLANYVTSLGRKPAWQMTAPELAEFYRRLAKQAAAKPVERGRYLVNSLGCAHCHTPLETDGSLVLAMKFAGGQRWRLNPFGDFVTYNLTSDKATGLGNWSDDEIKTLLTRGVRPDGSRMLPFPMPWPSYARLTNDDLNAVVAFLRTLPAISNKIPPPRAPNIAAYLWGKFRMLILKEDPANYVYPGNAGTPAPQTADRRATVTARAITSRRVLGLLRHAPREVTR